MYPSFHVYLHLSLRWSHELVIMLRGCQVYGKKDQMTFKVMGSLSLEPNVHVKVWKFVKSRVVADSKNRDQQIFVLSQQLSYPLFPVKIH
jgi:hypothetical protein